MARQDPSWTADYDSRHGSSVAARSQFLALEHGKRLAATLQAEAPSKGIQQYPELKPHYDALQAAAGTVRTLPAASQEKTLTALRTKLSGLLERGVGVQRPATDQGQALER